MKKYVLALSALALSSAVLSQTLCEDGFADIYPCDNVDLWSFMPTETIGGGANLNDIWGWTDIASGREFALVGKNSGTAFVEVTDPANPIYLGDLPTHNTNSLWRDVKVYEGHAFIVSEANGHGMQVFALAQLLNLEEIPSVFEETAHYDGFGKAHNVVINEETGYAYGVGATSFEGGLHIVNIQDPLNPVIAGDFAEDGYTHDAQVVNYIGPDKDYCGKEIAFCCNENSLTIVDVTDKTDTEEIAVQGYTGSAYAHQGWLTEDHKYFFLGDELDELNGIVSQTRTFIWDVKDLDNPLLLGFWDGSTEAIDHNLYVKWQMIFQSNYRSGLRILDASRVSEISLPEIGFFDVQPDDNNSSFSGTWSNYCYFPSGNVVVTDMYSGLFIVKPRVVTADYLVEILDDQNATTYNAYISYPADIAIVSVNNLPSGVSAVIEAVAAPGTTPIQLTETAGLDPGEYTFEISINADGNESVFEAKLVVLDQLVPFVNNVSPIDETLQPSSIEVTWTGNVDGADYFVEIADDADFTSIVHSENTTTTSATVPFDLPDGDYFWRVTASDACGISEVSEVTSFTVLFVGVTEYNANLTLALFPNPATEEIQISGITTEIDVLDLYSVDGKLIDSYPTNGATTVVLNVIELPTGIYMIRSSLGHQAKFTKL
ncbi:MAG: choice-of-anchor B domain-containing protein [Flavobacteriales bacterium]|jgi:choice-of-anchor B domain-containing protein